MLGLMRDEGNEQVVRFEAAKAAAPYVHARLSAIEANIDGEVTNYVVADKPMSEDEWEKSYGVGTPGGSTEGVN
jgi:hypothetical protein